MSCTSSYTTAVDHGSKLSLHRRPKAGFFFHQASKFINRQVQQYCGSLFKQNYVQMLTSVVLQFCWVFMKGVCIKKINFFFKLWHCVQSVFFSQFDFWSFEKKIWSSNFWASSHAVLWIPPPQKKTPTINNIKNQALLHT